MNLVDWKKLVKIDSSPEEILRNRKNGVIYSADFKSGEGKYISTSIKSADPVDVSIKISPKIELRLAYIIKEDRVHGIQLSKLKSDGTLDKIHLSTIDWDGVLALLRMFGDLDLKSIADKSLILDRSIVDDPAKLESFLITVASDPDGKKKFEEIADKFKLLKSGDVDRLADKITNTKKMKSLLDDKEYFSLCKQKLKVKKDEEVWQRFFTKNDWLLGSDVVEILDERVIDEDSVVDLPVKSLDGYLDVIELKLPDADLFNEELNPTSELSKSIMQCSRYISEYEKKANDHKKIKKIGVEIIKPRITLIIGRSSGWDGKRHERLRVLNACFHNITILTYDHVAKRADQIIKCDRGD